MSTICVDGTKVEIVAIPPLVLTKVIDTIAAGAQSLIKSSGKRLLLEKDFQQWVKNYQTDYVMPPYVVSGKLQGKSIALLGMSMKTTVNGEPSVLQTTTGIITLQVIKPAQMPPPVATPDSLPLYSAQLIMSNASQQLSRSL